MPSHLLKLRRNDRRLIDALLHPRMNIVRQAFQNRATWCLGSLRQRSKIQRCKTACACLQGIVFLPLSTRNTNIVKSWVTYLPCSRLWWSAAASRVLCRGSTCCWDPYLWEDSNLWKLSCSCRRHLHRPTCVQAISQLKMGKMSALKRNLQRGIRSRL